MANHKELYKFKGKDVADIKLTTISTLRLDQSRLRDKLVLSKRLKVESLEDAETKLSREEEIEKVENATRLLKQGKKVEALTTLHRCFAKDHTFAETFVRCEGLQPLQSCLVSSDSEVLHAAAWCVINLSAGQTSVVQKMMRFSPMLIQFLQGSDAVMQELCAWAIGNLAGDSHTSREVLLHQGCIPNLLRLISSKHQWMSQGRSQSVLLALINLARDESYNLIRCMHNNSVSSHLIAMLKEIPASSEMCCELGWLTTCIYSRQETFMEYKYQYDTILYLVVDKLDRITKLEDHIQREKVILPYLHCVGNCLGLSQDLAISASEHPNFLHTVISCLTCDIDFVQKETFRLFINFMADPSCRVLALCYPKFLTVLLDLCQSHDVECAVNALYLVETLTKVSCHINSHLIKQDIMAVLTKMLSSPESAVLEGAVNILTELVIMGTTEAKTSFVDSGGLNLLQNVVTQEAVSDNIKEKIQNLLELQMILGHFSLSVG